MALLPRFLIEAELARGDLVLAIDAQVESAEILSGLASEASYPPLQAFRAWLAAAARQA